MIDRLDSDDLQLPPELAELEAELDSIRYEERPSFGPELKAELEREWQTVAGRRHWQWGVRPLMAASVAALLMVSLGVPSARAALIRLVGVVQDHVVQASRPTPPAVTVPAMPVDQLAPAAVSGDHEEEAPKLGPDAAVPEPKAAEPYVGPEATMPKLIDRPGVEALIRRNYPIDLQRAGIGGVVGLQLWVDSSGAVDVANLAKRSGYGRLDRAALQVAPTFRFVPARRRGQAVGTWVEFDVRFQVPSADSVDVPDVREPGGTDAPLATLLPPPSRWRGPLVLSAPIDEEASDLLRKSFDDDSLLGGLGPIETILEGEPPAGVAPTAWRIRVGDALERAITHDPDNPAPFLALARIRRRQGLQTEARILFERGLQRAQKASEGTSRTILAELQYERGTLVKEAWMATRNLGRLPAAALDPDACPQASTTGGATSDFVPVERLIAWNYMCPAELGHAMETSFESSGGQDVDADYVTMMASLRSAVEAYPAHVGANVELLLELADEWRWDDVLDGAQRFVTASHGHPYALLLEGLALQRLGRSEDAATEFRRAFADLPADEADELRDPGPLLDAGQEARFHSLDRADRSAWLSDFWTPLDPILTTSVNEREVEHYARTAYARLRFGSAESDPGQVWVRYGRPNDIKVVADASGVRTEFWDYGGTAPNLTFRRLTSVERMDLTPEGKAYLDDLNGVFPQRYGADARVVSPLAAQVSRFRGDVPSRSVIDVNAEVPAGFATGDRDTLDVGVFLLDQAGKKLSASLRRVSATPQSLSMVLAAAPEARTVAVEFFHRGLGQAASMRQPAHGHEAEPGIAFSDVMVVHPADPDPQDIEHDAEWVHAYTLGQPVAQDSVGLLFDLYGLAPSVSEYRVRTELRDRSTGDVRSLPIRPAGLSGFASTWSMHPAEEETTHGYVTADLRGVPAGRYVLRVLADLPEVGRTLVLERDLDRR
ncbi:MAG: TonB family protein [Gemmatimonadetes bacterium]|nr:TonB family protein [Gemmatimonadota bacterium]